MLEPARIKTRKQWADGLISLIIDLPGPAFTPGQFFNLGLPDKDGKNLRRSYSAASAPGTPLEFLVSRVTDGALTPQLFDLQEGDELLLDPTPLGFFTLKEVPEADDLWLIATGTGLGPFLSMLRQGTDLERFQRVVLVHGVTEPARLTHQDELRTLADGQRLIYLPVTTRADPPAGGLHGRITVHLETGALEKAAGASIGTNSHLLLCGNPQLIEDVTSQLKTRGLSKHRRRTPGHYNFEKYWS